MFFAPLLFPKTNDTSPTVTHPTPQTTTETSPQGPPSIKKLKLPIAAGPYAGTLDSLSQYQYPEWFRDAKFGIWAHWGPQAVPMDGDWYARNMYIQGSPQYEDHLKRFGPPSKTGYIDIIKMWHAEKWDPEALMKLYKAAGAKYFVSMGTHHDDFFLWKSKIHRWNSVQFGPHRDVVGEWQKAAKANGMHFGVSEHLGASFTWFQPSHGSDKTGPYAGIPYDGADPKNWDLYHFPAKPGDTGWYSNDPRWQQQWYDQIKELVDNYHPDLLYSDGGVAFGNEVGLSQIANLYNLSAAAHGGQVEAVYTCKEPSSGRWVQDLERGLMGKINQNVWQTDTSIGDWFYNRNWKYQPVSWVINSLLDIVSKNGNLLLNIVLRPDGSLDPEVRTMLDTMATWMKGNQEGIFGSRPWLVYGEGPVRAKGGSFNENYTYGPKDIRFTTKGGALYAYALGQPADNTVTIHTLAKVEGDSSANSIQWVTLLRTGERLKWDQTTDGLSIQVPPNSTPDEALGLKIIGSNWKPVAPVVMETTVMPDKNGALNLLASEATLHGDGLQVEGSGDTANVGYWDDASNWISWKCPITSATTHFKLTYALIDGVSPITITIADGTHTVNIPVELTSTGSWTTYRTIDLPAMDLLDAHDGEVTIKATAGKTWHAVNIRSLVLNPDKP